MIFTNTRLKFFLSFLIITSTSYAEAIELNVPVYTAGQLDLYEICNNNRNEADLIKNGYKYCLAGDDRTIIQVESSKVDVETLSNGQVTIVLTVKQEKEFISSDKSSLTSVYSDRSIYRIQNYALLKTNQKAVISPITTQEIAEKIIQKWIRDEKIEVYGPESGTSTGTQKDEKSTAYIDSL